MQSYEILFVNDHLKKQLGEEMVGTICWKSLHEDMDRPCEFCTNDKLIDTDGNPSEPFIWEMYNQKLKRWYELHDQAIPWVDGRLVRLEMAVDITDRKKAEIGLHQFKHMVSSSTDMQAFLDRQFNYIAVNKAYSEAFHLNIEQFIGKKTEDIFGEEYFNNYIKPKADRCLHGEEINFQDWFDFPAYESRYCDVTYYPYRNDNSEIMGYVVHIRNITEQKKAQNEVKRQLLEKEVILKEVHHRIKNNFATVVSLLSLQIHAMSNPEAQSALQDAMGRVNSMQVLYEKMLLTGNYNVTSVKAYLDQLIDEIISIFPKDTHIIVEKQIDDFQLDPKRLVPVGIIVNELITNIIKYAYTGSDSGLIKITVKEDQGNITLTIIDNGRGLPEDFDIVDSGGFGLLLVKMLSQQLDGSFNIENQNGTRSILKFCV